MLCPLLCVVIRLWLLWVCPLVSRAVPLLSRESLMRILLFSRGSVSTVLFLTLGVFLTLGMFVFVFV